MSNFISAAAHAASQDLKHQGLTFKRTHLTEVIAALLGYKTYAALLAEEADTSRDYCLEDAEFIVLNRPAGVVRALALGLPESAADACAQAIKTNHIEPVYLGVDEFFDDRAREMLEGAIYEGEGVAGAMAESNASFPDSPEIAEWKSNGDLWASRDDWSLEGEGELVGEYDPDGDRMFNGDTLKVWGKLNFWKAGRAGLIFADSDDGGARDDSWRSDEFE